MREDRRVHFRLITADTEKDNNKAPNGNDRRFILTEAEPVTEDGGELIVRFEYRPDPEKRKQDAINTEGAQTILSNPSTLSWLSMLSATAPTPANPGRTLLAKHIADYTARNSFDYFIHKDVGGFLRRELDFFIKNEVMHLDDIQDASAPKVEQYLSRIKVLRSIAHRVIDFVAQLENFQKRLWLKKKFVVEAHYCVTLDQIPEDLYLEIAQNGAQREDWVRLFAIDQIGPGLLDDATYSVPLTVEFLKANPFLIVDTKFFPPGFRDSVLASIGDLDEALDGLLISSENFQALSLISESYRSGCDYVFIDPPYNTGVDGFPYKDSYQHSSWLSMMENRLAVCRRLLTDTAVIGITTDFVEVAKLRLLCDQVFGAENFLADVAWEKRYTRSNNANRFYSVKDTLTLYRSTASLSVLREGRSEKSKGNYTNPDNDPRGTWISSSYVNPARKDQRPKLVYEIQNPFSGVKITHPTHAWKYDPETHKSHLDQNRLYWGLDGGYEYPRLKSFLSEANPGMVPIDLWHYKDTGTTDDGGNVLKSLFGSAVFDNPKPPSLVRRVLQLSGGNGADCVVIDFFAGSGTTAHAVIEANREDEQRRKYVLVEMAQYFDSVLKPRVQKAVYSKVWKDGKPEGRDGLSHIFKYLRLESYEDTLANLEMRRNKEQQALLDGLQPVREEYTLRYMLDVESKGSPSLLNIDAFIDPFNYTLNIATGTVGETKPTRIDLVETFNYLLGLRVKHIDSIRGFRVVHGANQGGEKVLVIWRNIEESPNVALDEFFQRQRYNTKDMEFDLVYVNGDNNLENLKKDEDTWKVRLIEEEFARLMFDVQDV